MAYEVSFMGMAPAGAGISLDGGYPITGFRSTTGYTGANFTTSAIGDGSSGKGYALIVIGNAFSGSSFPFSVSGGSWSLAKRANFTNTQTADYGGVAIYTCTDALNSQVVTVSRQDGSTSDPWGWGYAVYRFSGSNTASLVGASNSMGSNSAVAIQVQLTPTYTGSYLIGGGVRGNYQASFSGLLAGNTQDFYGGLNASAQYDTDFAAVHGTSLSTASTPLTLGYSDATNTYNAFVAVEIRAA